MDVHKTLPTKRKKRPTGRRQPRHLNFWQRRWKQVQTGVDRILRPFVRLWRWFRAKPVKQQILIVVGVVLSVLILFPLLSYAYFVRDINDPDRLMNRNNTGLVLTDRHDETFYRFGRSQDDRNATLDEMPEHLRDALVASEDRQFYEHPGFSARNIAGALYANLLNRDISRYGGSTITQQLVKNNLLTDRQTFTRKYQELAMSIAIERRYSKDEILTMYLNSVYFGEGAFGIIQASEIYFDKQPSELTVAEATMLIGLLPAPSVFSPISGDPELTDQQQARVLERMVANDMLNQSEADSVAAEQLVFADQDDNEATIAAHFREQVLAELYDRYDEEEIARSGFRVRTTLDLDWHKQAENQLQQHLSSIAYSGATNGAIVAIDPTNGSVRVMIGSIDWSNEDFGEVNMALSPRQPGSTFKPIYFAEAFEQELVTPATTISDEPKVYGDYEPQNFDFRFRGDIAVRHALAQSLNIPAIEVMSGVGISETIAVSQRMGLTAIDQAPEVYGLPLALGTAEVPLIDMTNAYAAFANLGEQYDYTTIEHIENKFGRTVYQQETRAERVQSATASFLISSILSDERARAPTFGSSLNISGHEVAVKTGSTNDNRDAWTIGYTSDVTIGVWVGDNQNQPMTLGGSAAAGPIWRSSMQHVLADADSHEFMRPRGISGVQICNRHGDYIEFFIQGTQPDRCEPTVSDDDIERRQRQEEREAAEAEERRRQEEAAAEQEPPEEPEPIEEPEPEPITPPTEDTSDDPEPPEEDEDPEDPIIDDPLLDL